MEVLDDTESGEWWRVIVSVHEAVLCFRSLIYYLLSALNDTTGRIDSMELRSRRKKRQQ